MQSPCCREHFEREMGCSEADWLRWLPEAIGPHRWTLQGRACTINFDPSELPQGADGGADQGRSPARLQLSWQPLAPLSIALLTLPRLRVTFAFAGVDEDARQRFMRRFDLYLQRGGG